MTEGSKKRLQYGVSAALGVGTSGLFGTWRWQLARCRPLVLPYRHCAPVRSLARSHTGARRPVAKRHDPISRATIQAIPGRPCGARACASMPSRTKPGQRSLTRKVRTDAGKMSLPHGYADARTIIIMSKAISNQGRRASTFRQAVRASAAGGQRRLLGKQIRWPSAGANSGNLAAALTDIVIGQIFLTHQNQRSDVAILRGAPAPIGIRKHMGRGTGKLDFSTSLEGWVDSGPQGQRTERLWIVPAPEKPRKSGHRSGQGASEGDSPEFLFGFGRCWGPSTEYAQLGVGLPRASCCLSAPVLERRSNSAHGAEVSISHGNYNEFKVPLLRRATDRSWAMIPHPRSGTTHGSKCRGIQFSESGIQRGYLDRQRPRRRRKPVLALAQVCRTTGPAGGSGKFATGGSAFGVTSALKDSAESARMVPISNLGNGVRTMV